MLGMSVPGSPRSLRVKAPSRYDSGPRKIRTGCYTGVHQTERTEVRHRCSCTYGHTCLSALVYEGEARGQVHHNVRLVAVLQVHPEVLELGRRVRGLQLVANLLARKGEDPVIRTSPAANICVRLTCPNG